MRPGAALRRIAAVGLFGALLAGGTARATEPARTPTPRPRLSGGFGRPRATPAPASPEAQSLSDVVRAAGEARGGKPRSEKSGVTISNQTLVTDPQKGKVSTSSVVPAPTASEPVPKAPAAAAAETVASEAQWRAAAGSGRERVREAKSLVEQLTAEAAKLESDFYAWDDGQYRDNVIKPAWDEKKEELEAAKKELALAEKDLADLPEKARKAGALPGWLRE